MKRMSAEFPCLRRLIVRVMVCLLGCTFPLKNDVFLLTIIESKFRLELFRKTGGEGVKNTAINQCYQCLDDGVVGSVHVGVEGERALSLAVVGCVAFGSDDPILRQDRNDTLIHWITQVYASVHFTVFSVLIQLLRVRFDVAGYSIFSSF